MREEQGWRNGQAVSVVPSGSLETVERRRMQSEMMVGDGEQRSASQSVSQRETLSESENYLAELRLERVKEPL